MRRDRSTGHTGRNWRRRLGRGEFLHHAHLAVRHLRINVLEHLGHLLGGDAVQRTQAHLHAGVLARFVEPADEVLNLREVTRTRDDGDGVVQPIRLNDRLLLLITSGENRLDLGNHIVSLRLLQPDELHIAFTAIRTLVQRRQNLFHHAEMRPGA